MDGIISQDTMVQILQLGSQYALPIAALLRALYAGVRQRFPEGFTQIGIASFFAGLTSVFDTGNVDLGAIIAEVMGNTVFVFGVLSFTLIYLLRQPFRGLWVDAVVGGVLGLAAWAVWVYLLLNAWPIWTFPLAIIAGAAGFIALRFALRQIIKVMRIATFFLIGGILLIALGAGAWVLVTLANQPTPVG
jgi:hypothetical protein